MPSTRFNCAGCSLRKIDQEYLATEPERLESRHSDTALLVASYAIPSSNVPREEPTSREFADEAKACADRIENGDCTLWAITGVREKSFVFKEV